MIWTKWVSERIPRVGEDTCHGNWDRWRWGETRRSQTQNYSEFRNVKKRKREEDNEDEGKPDETQRRVTVNWNRKKITKDED